jgi:ribonuclease G
MTRKKLVVNAEGSETRVALTESGELVEYFLERKRETGVAGNIYRGRINRVLPGMQAAFVDLAQEEIAPRWQNATFTAQSGCIAQD